MTFCTCSHLNLTCYTCKFVYLISLIIHNKYVKVDLNWGKASKGEYEFDVIGKQLNVGTKTDIKESHDF